MPGPDLTPHPHSVTPLLRSLIKPHGAACLWFTGLPGSGKSTLANLVELRLNQEYGAHTYLLDGDSLRSGLNRDLGFSLAARTENIRRAGEVAKLFVDAGLIVLTAFISPLRADREAVRALLPPGAFIEIYVDCPLEVCEQRDPKGLYARARRGEISEFTGLTSPYEPPPHPELSLPAGQEPAEACAQRVLDYLLQRKLLAL
jgi:adenylyl-sulfate kinase